MNIEIDSSILIECKSVLDDLMAETKDVDIGNDVKEKVHRLYGEISVSLIKAGLAKHREDGFVEVL